MEIIQFREYEQWINKLRDKQAVFRIDSRILKIQRYGNLLGDFKSVGEGVYELRFHFGPGYRVYVSPEDGNLLLLLLSGGDKSTQQKDIEQAKSIAKEWRKQNGK